MTERFVGFGFDLQFTQTRRQFHAGIRTEHDGSAQRRLGRHASHGCCGRVAGRFLVSAIGGQAARDVLFEYGMEVRTAETECTDAGAAHATGRLRPVSELRVDVEWRVIEIDVRVLFATVEAGRQHLVIQRQCRFQQTGGAGGALQVADVRFNGAQGNAVRLCARAREHVSQALDLDDVADTRRRTVALDVTSR